MWIQVMGSLLARNKDWDQAEWWADTEAECLTEHLQTWMPGLSIYVDGHDKLDPCYWSTETEHKGVAVLGKLEIGKKEKTTMVC